MPKEGSNGVIGKKCNQLIRNINLIRSTSFNKVRRKCWKTSWILSQLDVRYYHKLSSYSISRKTYDPNSGKWRKTSFWA